MKPTLMFAALTMMVAASPTFAKSELETLRSLCAEQERQIRQLELENSRLRSDEAPTQTLAPKPKSEPKIETHSSPQLVAAKTPSESTYSVKAGDSIERIARKVGTTPVLLAKANGITTSAVIRPGQLLIIPTTGAQSPAKPAATAAASPAAQPNGKTHTIQQGETFFSISKKYRISTATLIAANPQLKPSALRPGQIVKLTGEGPAPTQISAPVSQPKAPTIVEKPRAVAEKPRATAEKPSEMKPTSTPARAANPAPASAPAPALVPAPTPVAEPPTTAAVVDGKPHPIIIEREMTYGEFATKHGTDAARLNSLNGLDLNNATILAKGSELYVPARP